MEIGLDDGYRLRKKGRRLDFSPPPPDRNRSPPPSRKETGSHSASICSDGREHSRRRGFQIPVSPRLASSPISISPNLPPMGNASNRSFCDGRLDSTDSVLCLGSNSEGRGVRCSPPALGFRSRLPVSPSGPAATSSQQDSAIFRQLHSDNPILAVTEMVSSSSGSSNPGREETPTPSGCGGGPDNGNSSAKAQSSSSSRLEDYRRFHASSMSDESFRLITGSWRKSSSARYDAAWSSFKDFLSTKRLPLDQVNLTAVSDYLTHLFNKGLAYRTICLHRSVLSVTLPHVDGDAIGEHPIICRLIKGIFHRRPPHRRVFQSWDVGKAFNVFSDWSSPLTLKQLQRKTAFLLAMATAKRPSELASLQCSASFMSSTSSEIRFIPSFLSMTDRQTDPPGPAYSRQPDVRFRLLSLSNDCSSRF